jgi:hypothetical protein
MEVPEQNIKAIIRGNLLPSNLSPPPMQITYEHARFRAYGREDGSFFQSQSSNTVYSQESYQTQHSARSMDSDEIWMENTVRRVLDSKIEKDWVLYHVQRKGKLDLRF